MILLPKSIFKIYRFKRMMIINLAGQAAIARYLKKPFHQKGAGKDLQNFADIAYEVFSDRKVVNAYFAYIIEEARVFVSRSRHWKCIIALSKELIKEKKLSKKAIQGNLLFNYVSTLK